MNLTLLKSKIHRATVTDADLNYQGSISIDPELCKAARLYQFEKVDIYNCNNGARLSTYVIFGKPGEICLNGAAARHAQKGDIVIIVCYGTVDENEASSYKPRLVMVDEKNQIIEASEYVIPQN